MRKAEKIIGIENAVACLRSAFRLWLALQPRGDTETRGWSFADLGKTECIRPSTPIRDGSLIPGEASNEATRDDAKSMMS
jgi:hypothetical protein